MRLSFVPAFTLELESGLGDLELESGESLLLENDQSGAVFVADENPVYAIPYLYWQPQPTFQMEPSDQVNPVYFESWQNLSTQLMPNIYPRDLEGLYASGMTGGSWETMQLSTPVFPPDGVAVKAPGQVELINNGAGTVELVGPEG